MQGRRIRLRRFGGVEFGKDGKRPKPDVLGNLQQLLLAFVVRFFLVGQLTDGDHILDQLPDLIRCLAQRFTC